MGCCSSKATANGTYEPSPFTMAMAVKSKSGYKPQSFDAVVGGGPTAKILVVATDEGELKMANGKVFNSGNNPEEMFVPLLHFKAAGFAFEFATVSGKPVVIEMWAFPSKDPVLAGLHQELKPLLETPTKLADVTLDTAGSKYAGIYIPGGHGAMVNLPESLELGKLLLEAHAAGLPTIALCHGPAALLAASKIDGAEFPYKQYRMVCFSDKTDKLTPKLGYLPGAMPWLVQAALKKQGAVLLNNSEKGAVEVDRELVTGDSPQASNNIGKTAVPILVAAWAEKHKSPVV